jgi:2-haloacid dehalogenase
MGALKMAITRREFVARAGLAAGVLAASPRMLLAGPNAKQPIKAVAFDAFPIFDPRPVVALADHLFPGKGIDLSNEWRTRQFEYTWLRMALRRYADFWQVTQDSLVFAANRLKIELSPQQRDQLMNAYLELKAWPDVSPALSALKKSGVRLVFLSNFTARMLDGCIRSAGLEGMFEHVLSTDQVKTYKPDPLAYQLGTDVLKLRRDEVLFAAFAGWDAAGAKAFGYPTFWVNRLKLPVEELGEVPDGQGSDLAALVEFLAY